MVGAEGGELRVPVVLRLKRQEVLSEFLEAEIVQEGAGIAAMEGEVQELLPPGPETIAVKVVEEVVGQSALELIQLEPEALKPTPPGELILAPVATPTGVTVTVQRGEFPVRETETLQVGAIGPTGAEEQEVFPPGPEIVAVKVVEEF